MSWCASLQVSIKLGSLEILRDASIKGDTIYFPHDGPKEAAATLRERAAWLRGADYRVLFVGADDKHDKLAQWLLKRNDIQVCPHRCHNTWRCTLPSTGRWVTPR